MSMLSLMTALIVGVEARACMALGCNKSAWQVESRPAESSSDRMCASVGPESEHVGKRRDPGSIPRAITNEQVGIPRCYRPFALMFPLVIARRCYRPSLLINNELNNTSYN